MKTSKVTSVLVTGGAGYIGSHTCKALAAAGYNPVSFDNLTLGHRWAVQWGPLVEADLLDADAVQRALREYNIEAVIHFAASAYVGDSMRDPAAYYRNNVLTTLALLDAMRSANVRDIIFSSSCAVYGNPSLGPIDETHPTGPLSPYGQSKLDGENALRWYGQAYDLRWMALRYFNAAGADAAADTGEDHSPETRLVPRAIMAAMGSGSALQIFGADYPTPDGTAIRDYIHVSDLARAHVSALVSLNSGAASQVLNLGTGRGYSVREVLTTVGTVLGRGVPHSIAPRRSGDPAEVVADARRAAAVLGWAAQESSLETIVATAARWHAKHTGLVKSDSSVTINS
jgi:UDP-arabinose 4-epimerase